jgi:hypothetical protein
MKKLIKIIGAKKIIFSPFPVFKVLITHYFWRMEGALLQNHYFYKLEGALLQNHYFAKMDNFAQ